MFKTLELTFRTYEHKFKTTEHKLPAGEHNNYQTTKGPTSRSALSLYRVKFK